MHTVNLTKRVYVICELYIKKKQKIIEGTQTQTDYKDIMTTLLTLQCKYRLYYKSTDKHSTQV